MSKLGPIANRKAESGKGLFTPNSEDGEAEKIKKRKKKTVHEDNPRQTYKMIYGLIKQGNLKAKLHY